MKNEQQTIQFPLPTIRRYPIYLRTIKSMIAAGELHISSAILAERLGLDPVLTRKDLASPASLAEAILRANCAKRSTAHSAGTVQPTPS